MGVIRAHRDLLKLELNKKFILPSWAVCDACMAKNLYVGSIRTHNTRMIESNQNTVVHSFMILISSYEPGGPVFQLLSLAT